MKKTKHRKANYWGSPTEFQNRHASTVIVPAELVELENNSFHLVLPVEINGQKGDMIIDTGASVTVIDRHLVTDRMPEQSHIQMQSGSVSGEIEDVKVVEIEKFKIGERRIRTTTLAAIDLDYVNEMYSKRLNRKIVGLLGCDFCVKHEVVIDYPNKRLIFKS